MYLYIYVYIYIYTLVQSFGRLAKRFSFWINNGVVDEQCLEARLMSRGGQVNIIHLPPALACTESLWKRKNVDDIAIISNYTKQCIYFL